MLLKKTYPKKEFAHVLGNAHAHAHGSGGRGKAGSWSNEPGFGAGGYGVFDLDSLYVLWNGLYVDGVPTAGTYDDEETGEVEDFVPQITFAFVDSGDHTTGGLDYICYARYDALDDGVVTADFTGYPDWEGYDGWSWQLDSLGAEARYEGACSDVATLLGVTKVDNYIDLYTWGIGWGPMTDDLAAAYAEGTGAAPDADQGTAYLEWNASGVSLLNTWALFRVYPLV